MSLSSSFETVSPFSSALRKRPPFSLVLTGSEFLAYCFVEETHGKLETYGHFIVVSAIFVAGPAHVIAMAMALALPESSLNDCPDKHWYMQLRRRL